VIFVPKLNFDEPKGKTMRDKKSLDVGSETSELTRWDFVKLSNHESDISHRHQEV
jgi:hypothetical protein